MTRFDWFPANSTDVLSPKMSLRTVRSGKVVKGETRPLLHPAATSSVIESTCPSLVYLSNAHREGVVRIIIFLRNMWSHGMVAGFWGRTIWQ